MNEPVELEGPDADPPVPPGRGRRIVQVAIILALVVAMVFLAFISGRGVVTVRPDTVPAIDGYPRDDRHPTARRVDADGHLLTMDAAGSAVTPLGGPDTQFTFPAWSPDGIADRGHRHDRRGRARLRLRATDERRAATDPVDGVPQRRPAAVLPVLVAGWPAADVPDDRAGRAGVAHRAGRCERAGRVDPSGSPLYWAWAGPDRLLVHSGVEGGDGFFGEIGLDGASLEPESPSRQAASGPPASRPTAGSGPSSAPERTPNRSSWSRPTARPGTPPTVFGTTALDFGPAGDELAFIAPSAAGRAVSLPIGPLRLIDAASGVVRTVLADPVVAFFWSPDGATLAALQIAPAR